MARFTYTAEKNEGEVYKGVAEARDRFELYEIVRKEGAHIVSLQEEKSSDWMNSRYWSAKMSRVKDYDKILFARNLGAMLSAGLSLSRALAVIERQTKNPKLVEVVSQVSSDVRRGDTLHAALAKFPNTFPGLFAAMVRAGEEGGDLASTLTLVADQMERMYSLKKKIRGALIYPCIILVAIVGIGIIMMIAVVPTLAATFAEMNAQLPFSTKIVLGISAFLVNNTIMAAVLFLVVVAVIYLGLRTVPGQRFRDWAFLKLPLIGTLVREVNAARTARTLASLLSAGVDVITSLEISAQVVQNVYFREVIATAQKAVAQGEPLSVSFARREDLYPAFVGEMMSVGEETGQTSEMLKRLALFYEEEVDSKTRDMSTIIEPFLMVFIGGMVGFFAVSMIAPIYQLSSHIQ